jgi:N-acetylglucosamine-6-phosphate deacetylase
MNSRAERGRAVLIEGHVVSEGAAGAGWVAVRDGLVQEVRQGPPPAQPDRRAHFVARGLCDLQVNGAGGRNVTGGEDALRAIDEIQLAHGVTSYLPTVISTSDREAAEAVAAIALRMQDPDSPIAGVHLEGPFLDPQHRGVHREEHLKVPADGVPDYLWSGAVRMVTLAPELPGALELIEKLRSNGVIVSIGHSGASEEEAARGFEAGATSVTHLFNGMKRFEHRHPNIPGWALAEGGVTVCVIPDGHHVHPLVLKLVDRAARDRVVLVTDATPAAGADPGLSVTMAGVDLRWDGDMVVDPDGRLAGSSLTLDAAVRQWVSHTGAPPAEAVLAASERPARLLGLPGLQEGAPADLVLLDATLRVEAVMRNGEWVR